MSLLKNSAISIVSLIITLLVLEMLVRVFSPQTLRLNFSQWDEHVGFVNIPGIRGTTFHEDYKMTVQINSKGLRDREISYSKDDNVIRIGAFGDSFTFGEGVQNSETYPKLLENLLNADAQLTASGKRIEVLNFGIGKTGTSHQYAFYQKEGKNYDLDLVIIGFLAANDFGDNLSGVFAIEDGRLVHNPAAYSSIRRLQKVVYYFPFYEWLAAHSHLTNLVRKEVTRLDDQWRAKAHASAESAATQEDKDRLAVEITRKLLVEFARELKQDGVKMVLASLPAKNQKPLAEYKSDSRPSYVVQYHQLARSLLETPELGVIDLTSTFARMPAEPYYFPHDGHMTPLGLQVVAYELKSHLKPVILKEFEREFPASRRR